VLIATADDDTVYPRTWLSDLAAHHDRHRCIVSHRGHYMPRRKTGFWHYRKWMNHEAEEGQRGRPSLFNLPTGKDGVLYDPAFFHAAVLDVDTALAIAPTTDDLWFKWHTAARDVPVHIISPSYRQSTFPTITDGPSLYDAFNREGGNDKAVLALEAYAKERLGFELRHRRDV
jgi:hypothetical protein